MSYRRNWIAIIVVILGLVMFVSVVQAQPQDIKTLAGVWKLVACDIEYQDSGKRQALFGERPRGFIIFTPGGRMMTLFTSEGRKPGDSVEQKAELFRTMMAYTGIFRLDGDKFINRVDVSWNEAWTGTEQVRFFKFNDNRLEIMSAWIPDPFRPEHRISRGILSWERVE